MLCVMRLLADSIFVLGLSAGAAACFGKDEAPSVTGPVPTETMTPIPAPTSTGVPHTPSAPINPAGQDARNGPWNRDLVLYRSSDGSTFTKAGTFVERAGVPNVIRDGSGGLVAVFQWFPFDNRAAFDRVAVAFSTDNGATWTKPAQMTFSGLPESLMRPFDPTMVQLSDGRYRLYFTSNERGSLTRPAIYSAISSDGISYQFEPGARFAPAGGTVDCSVVFYKGAWQLFSHTQQANSGSGYHAVSADGLAFTQQPNVTIGAGRQWIGNAVVIGGTLRYYGSGREGLWVATSTDGSAWTLEAPPDLNLGDPSVVVLPSGELLLLAVGDLRADAGPAPD